MHSPPTGSELVECGFNNRTRGGSTGTGASAVLPCKSAGPKPRVTFPLPRIKSAGSPACSHCPASLRQVL